ncbi:hypothetical protein [Siansivirga zeaxanthinifaciens]|uniref:Uncharacterized protein n=1 Tax=Siansivirga zeaxanthinifaciens CC-SAMT-1 TaxID=1454006 RepID=A0A0C5WCN1_9FLAO|nr:hypothetical protein [Siansivirga zeaxanthinifaciens]AJR04768.1 hypothetical protein AW14_03820 [Siansivirga zeaxanthinifaciens CC-SAMT-1]
MKNLILAVLVVFISSSVFAQKRSDFKGPAYKNYKPWLHKNEVSLVYTTSQKSNLTSYEYKNYKPWQDDSKVKYTAITFGSERSKLRGPAYKNYKPWRKKNN